MSTIWSVESGAKDRDEFPRLPKARRKSGNENRRTYLKMKDNMDVDVSNILQGRETASSAGKRIFEEVVSVASGKVTKAEKLGQRDFSIFKMNPNR